MSGLAYASNDVDKVMSDVVSMYVNKYGAGLSQVWLFGSKARADASNDSDLDVMIVVDDSTAIDKGFNEAEYEQSRIIMSKHNELLSAIVTNNSDFNHRQLPLYENIKRDGVIYYEK